MLDLRHGRVAHPGRQRPARLIRSTRLIPMVGLIIVLVAGVLGMHTLAADSSGHSASTAVQAAGVHGAGASQADAHASSTDTACHQACPSSSSPGHDRSGMLTMCVLALLAGLLLLLPPAISPIARSANPIWAPAMHPRRANLLPRPPSLILLSISRT